MIGRLSITVGLPGSGKTHCAKLMQEDNPDEVVLISRDDLRETLYASSGILSNAKEQYITRYQETLVKDNLRMGMHVIVHDMNLRERYRKRWTEIAKTTGADFDIIDLTQVPLETCIKRDQMRHDLGLRSVGGEVISDLERKFRATLRKDVWKPYKLYPSEAFNEPVVLKPYVSDLDKPKAIIVDIDGTVADCEGIRSPYDYTKVSLDKPKTQVIKFVQSMAYDMGYKILFVSGRLAPYGSQCYKDTEEWLYENVKVPIEQLYTREVDKVEDSVIKYQIFDGLIRHNYNVQFVLDDRNRVADMWKSIGLLTLQPERGDF